MANKDLSLSVSIEKQKINFIFSRWFFLILILTIYFIQDIRGYNTIFVKVFVISVLYNLGMSIYIIISIKKGKEVRSFFAFFDTVVVCFYIYMSGGVKSDIFFMFFFVLAYNGIKTRNNKDNHLGVFTVITYSIVSLICILQNNSFNVDIVKLISKDFLIILTNYGIYLIKKEVRKFDELHKKEFKLARTDKLTGLANRHYLEQKLREEVDYCDYNNKKLNFLLFDLDNFKKFNDTYGHIWGDKLLVLFGDILKECLRKTDFAVRYGGEEFLILLRDIDNNSAKNIGERIRKQLECQRIDIDDNNKNKRVTVSCGLAQYPTDSKKIKEVIDCADKALYYAKERGKNNVVRYVDIK